MKKKLRIFIIGLFLVLCNAVYAQTVSQQIKDLALQGKEEEPGLWFNNIEEPKSIVGYSKNDESYCIVTELNGEILAYGWSKEIGFHQYFGNNIYIPMTEEDFNTEVTKIFKRLPHELEG